MLLNICGFLDQIKLGETDVWKHPNFHEKEEVTQAGSSARGFSPARKIHLFLGSLSLPTSKACFSCPLASGWLPNQLA